MKQYLDLLRLVLAEGEWKENRTGVRSLSYPGAQMRFDLTQGFPAMTVRRLAFKAAVGELCGFLRGFDSAADFRAIGCGVWDKNANENAQWLANPLRKGEDHLGRLYGVQWRNWQATKLIGNGHTPWDGGVDLLEEAGWEYVDHGMIGDGPDGAEAQGYDIYHKKIDQVAECLRKIMEDPDDRRIIFHGWNPAELDEMALPPCHLLYQFHPNRTNRTISMTMYIRSNDLGLGAPFNVCEAATLLSLVGRLTGYEPKILTVQIGDAHIYEDQLELVNDLIARTPEQPPRFLINPLIRKAESVEEAVQALDRVHPTDFWLEQYVFQESDVKPPSMAV